MAQRKFLKPIVGGAIGLAILGIAGAVYASGETVTITASGTGSGTNTTAVVYADSTLTCDITLSGSSNSVMSLGWYPNSGSTGILEPITSGSASTYSLNDVLGPGLIAKGDTIYCTPTFGTSASFWVPITAALPG